MNSIYREMRKREKLRNMFLGEKAVRKCENQFTKVWTFLTSPVGQNWTDSAENSLGNKKFINFSPISLLNKCWWENPRKKLLTEHTSYRLLQLNSGKLMTVEKCQWFRRFSRKFSRTSIEFNDCIGVWRCYFLSSDERSSSLLSVRVCSSKTRREDNRVLLLQYHLQLNFGKVIKAVTWQWFNILTRLDTLKSFLVNLRQSVELFLAGICNFWHHL